MTAMNCIPINDLPFVAFIIGLDGTFKAINTSAEKFTGYYADELIGQPVKAFVGKKYSRLYDEFIQECATSAIGTSLERTIELITKFDEEICGKLQVNKTENGYFALFNSSSEIKTFLDTPKKGTTQKILNDIQEPHWEWDIPQNIIYYSAKLMQLFGYEEKAFTGPKSFWDKHLSSTDLNSISNQIDALLSREIHSINVNCTLNNEKNNLSQNINIVGKISEYLDGHPIKAIGFMKVISSVLPEKITNEGYLKLDEKLCNTGHWRLDALTQEMFWSPGGYKIHGATPNAFSVDVESAVNFYIEKDRPKVKALLEGAIDKAKGFYFKSTIINKQGKNVKIECLGEVEKNKNNEVVAIYGVFKDITKQEENLEKLKLLAMVNYNIKVPIFFIDEQDNVVYQDLSPQLENNSSVLFNYINFSIEEYLKFKKKTKDKGQVKVNNLSFDKYITVFDLTITYEDNEGIYIWIVDNVTEKFRKEQQQIVSNRMALLGNTFGNVSHDINNVLGVALGAIEMLELKFSKGEQDISSYINRVKNAIDKGKSVTERLLAFTKKPTVNVVAFDPLADIIENQHLFEQLLLTTVDFSYDFKAIHSLIRFPQGEFINIILNLVLNAQDAIRENSLIGKIKVSAEVNEASQLLIHVDDSGVGIKPENLTKVFDPFYSSKSVNKGNGIGLANVYSTIYKHNGEISVEGHGPLGGARFTLTFNAKISSKILPKEEEKPVDLKLDEIPILVLDDEESIAEFVALFLEENGAFSKYVSTKEDLIQVLECKQEYEVFITDMILPDISGREAVELVLARYPNIKIYSMSGYIGEKDSDWKYPVLRKPFNSDDLAEFLTNN